MTVPNFITIIRIIITPIFIIYLINDEFLPALFLFILAGLTDAADGLIARLFNQKSELGAFLDPLADKILLIAAFVALSVKGLVPPWLSVIVISRDILILLGVLILFLNNQIFAFKPFIISKATTCLQLTTVFMVLSIKHFAVFERFAVLMFWVTGLLTVTSCLHYMIHWFRMMGEGPTRD